jgi:hypothetical protein
MKRVFVCFRPEDKEQVSGVRLLVSSKRLSIEHYDVPVGAAIHSADATRIRRRIREKIDRTTVTVCLISDLTFTSQSVVWALEESIDKGNTIICMALPNSPPELTLPEPARRLNLGWWAWDAKKLDELIEAAP